jgi:Na+-translocating ferredoxin:NAD+ oxidoreductase RnfE subunit
VGTWTVCKSSGAVWRLSRTLILMSLGSSRELLGPEILHTPIDDIFKILVVALDLAEKWPRKGQRMLPQ